MNALRFVENDLTLFCAGLPRFPRNFTRDSIITALLTADPDMMRDQLLFCTKHQGQKSDPQTGEEVGKFHHEWPGHPIRGRMTTYNACDSVAYFLIGHGWLAQATGSKALAVEQTAVIETAVSYIQAHLNKDDLFEESPRYCGADQFALKVTYWKDSVILDRENGEPAWPAVFPLAHIQNLCGLRSAARLFERSDWQATAQKMQRAIEWLWDDRQGTFHAAIDAMGPISAITSDGLHALYYLEEGDLSAKQIKKLVQTSEALETSIGYLVMSPEDGQRMSRAYHGSTVWPFEQALIHAGAGKFGLDRVQRVCRRVLRAVDEGDPEVVEIQIDKKSSLACDPQLWTIAAKTYFENKDE